MAWVTQIGTGRSAALRLGLALLLGTASPMLAFAGAHAQAASTPPVSNARAEHFEGIYRERLSSLGEAAPETFNAMYELARVYREDGRLADAETMLLRVLEEREAHPAESSVMALQTMTELGTVYDLQERYRDAEILLLRALEIAEGEFGSAHALTIGVQFALASSYGRSRRADEATELLEAALEHSEEVLGPTDTTHLALLNSRALAYLRENAFDEALTLFTQLYDITARELGENHRSTISVLSNLAYLYRRARHYDVSLSLTDQVMQLRAETLGAAHPETLAAASMSTVMRLSLPELGGSPLPSAELLVTGLDQRMHQSGFADGTAPSNRLSAEAQLQREEGDSNIGYGLYADAVLVTIAEAEDQREMASRAFSALQNAMSSPVSGPIAQMAATRFADQMGENLGNLVREREVLQGRWGETTELYAFTFGGGEDIDLAERSTARAALDSIEARISEIDGTLRSEFPDYFALTSPDPVALDAAREMLGPDEAILMIVPTRLNTHLFVINHDNMSWQRSDWTGEQIDAAVRRLRWDVGATVQVTPDENARWTAEQGEGLSYDRGTAYQLYQQIIAPVADTLEGRENVFVIAGGALSGLPFSILVVDPPEGEDSDPEALRATRWFADAHALTHIPSVRSLELLRQVENGGADIGGFAGFGDPVLQGIAQTRGIHRGAPTTSASEIFAGADQGEGIANVGALRRMSRLPGTAVELENMRIALGAPESALWLADSATETAVRQADLSQVGILAFATHGLMANEVNDIVESGLVMTPPTTPSAEDDGYLSASEVSALRLNADWVILSACNTAADSELGAPGLSGLARAFFYAGARNLLASYWPVDDDVAARLTVRTIGLRQADASLSRAQAFQQAMREIRNDASHDTAQSSWAHPAYWGPFTLIGDGAQ